MSPDRGHQSTSDDEALRISLTRYIQDHLLSSSMPVSDQIDTQNPDEVFPHYSSFTKKLAEADKNPENDATE